MGNPWIELPMSGEYVLPSDRAQVTAFNNRPRLSERRRLQLHVLPEPYIGSINAPIVLLKLNPGYTPADIRFTEHERARQVWRKNLLHEALDYPFYVLDPELCWAENAKWWRSKLTRILALVDERTVANNVMCIEAFPYHSYKAPYFPGILPSQHYNFALVDRAIDRGALILMANTMQWWLEHVPRLRGYANLYVARVFQGGHVTPAYYSLGFEEAIRVIRGRAQ